MATVPSGLTHIRVEVVALIGGFQESGFTRNQTLEHTPYILCDRSVQAGHA